MCTQSRTHHLNHATVAEFSSWPTLQQDMPAAPWGQGRARRIRLLSSDIGRVSSLKSYTSLRAGLDATQNRATPVRLAGSGPRHCSSCRGKFDKDMFSPHKLHVPRRNRRGGRSATASRAGHTRVFRRFSFRQYCPHASHPYMPTVISCGSATACCAT